MGASNIAAAYALYAGRVPPLSMVCLTYMALVSLDDDQSPWYGQGHAALAAGALGRPLPIAPADIKAVERAIGPLLAAGAIVTDRRASVRRDGHHTVRYRLNLSFTGLVVPRNPGDDKGSGIDQSTVDNPRQDPPRPPESGTHVPRKPSRTSPGIRPHVPRNPGDRGTKRNQEELGEEYALALPADVTASRARDPTPAAADTEPPAGPPPALHTNAA